MSAVLVGVKPAERVKVTKFADSLFNQHEAPLQGVEDLAGSLPATGAELVRQARVQFIRALGVWLDASGKKWLDEPGPYNEAWVQGVLQHDIEAEAGIAQLPPEFRNERAKMAFLSLDDPRDMFGPQARAPIEPKPDLRWLWGLLPIGLLLTWLVMRARAKHSAGGAIFATAFGVVALAVMSLGMFWPVIFPTASELANDAAHRAEIAANRAYRTHRYAEQLASATRYTTRKELEAAMVPAVPSFDVSAELQERKLPPDGAIVGSQLGFFTRDFRGIFSQPPEPLNTRVVLSVFPASSTGFVRVDTISAVNHQFTLVDSSHTGQFDIDQTRVYASFDIVQQLAGMAAGPGGCEESDPAVNFPPRCEEVFIKIKNATASTDLQKVKSAIVDWIDQYESAHPEIAPYELHVQTWDEKQERYLNAVKNEKVMIVFILGLMSLVVLVVIFLIFYQIVRDKTRDIGIIKAVGGSEAGVAGIFLTYGLFVGIVGGGLGVITGVLFVTHTNEIHEWIYRMTGIVIWDRSVYIFDQIPSRVYFSDCVMYFGFALAAGLLGALIPAFVAAAEDPVKAVRYE